MDVSQATKNYFKQPGSGGDNQLILGGTVQIENGAVFNSALGPVNTAITTVGNGTLTAAALVGGAPAPAVITRSGSTAAYTDTTDTAAAIIAALPGGGQIGASWELVIVNTVAFAQTLSAGVGVTLAGLAGPIPANATARAVVSYTGAGAVTITIIEISYDAAGGFDPSSVATQFGGGTATFLEEGNVNKQVNAVASGVAPGATGADNVVAVYSLPANSLDGISNRMLTITAWGSFAANANTKRIKLWFNPATAVVGNTVGAGGTLLADTGAVTTSGGGWQVSGNVTKRGAANSNTQLCTSNGAIAGGTHTGMSAPVDATATENAAILIAVTINNTTAVGDALFDLLTVNGMN